MRTEKSFFKFAKVEKRAKEVAVHYFGGDQIVKPTLNFTWANIVLASRTCQNAIQAFH